MRQRITLTWITLALCLIGFTLLILLPPNTDTNALLIVTGGLIFLVILIAIIPSRTSLLEYTFSNLKGKVTIALIAIIYLTIIISGIEIFSRTTTNPIAQTFSENSPWLIIAITLAYGTIITISATASYKGNKQYQQQTHNIDKKNEQLFQDLSATVNTNTHTSIQIQIQLNEMKGYYAFAKRQAVISSTVSIACIIAGVALGMTLIAITLLTKSTNIPLTYITGLLATLTELVGGLAFFFYKQTAQQMDRYFISLESLRNTMVSLDLIDKYTNEEKRQQALDKILESLIAGKTEQKEQKKK